MRQAGEEVVIVAMAEIVRIATEPEVLVWARQTASLDHTSAASRIGVSPKQLSRWESGDLMPTIIQCRKMADVYGRPLAALFLSEPISNETLPQLPDFRRESVREEAIPPALQKGILRAHAQRDGLRHIARSLGIEETSETPWVLASTSLPLSKDLMRKSSDALRERLELDSMSPGALRSPEEFFRQLSRTAESRLGVNVIQLQRVDIRDMRGFSLSDGSFPVIALNGADSPRGKAFTLLHELVHVGLRTSSLCDFDRHSISTVERTCDEIAASVLMPRQPFLSTVEEVLSGGPITLDQTRSIGRRFGSSGEAVTLRMVELNIATWDDYWRLQPQFREAYADYRARARKQRQESDSDARIYYQLKVRDLGRHYIQEVVSAHNEDLLSSSEVTRMLDVGYEGVGKLADKVGMAG